MTQMTQIDEKVCEQLAGYAGRLWGGLLVVEAPAYVSKGSVSFLDNSGPSFLKIGVAQAVFLDRNGIPRAAGEYQFAANRIGFCDAHIRLTSDEADGVARLYFSTYIRHIDPNMVDKVGNTHLTAVLG